MSNRGRGDEAAQQENQTSDRLHEYLVFDLISGNLFQARQYALALSTCVLACMSFYFGGGKRFMQIPFPMPSD
ncbi:hypothetical protein AB4851_12680 [Burkholderia sp. 22PA0099]|uniref:hypothetical protein n=1 Tax=Burkholderia sp. 22PA0099 TaxID=3237372 RepID=UPI0039C0B429